MGKRICAGCIVVIIIVCVVAAVCLFGNPKEAEAPNPSKQTFEDTPAPAVQVQVTETPDAPIPEVIKLDNVGKPWGTIYRSEKMLYMSPLNSAWLLSEEYDSKAYYRFTDIGFERMEKVEKGKAGIRWDYYLPEGGPKWERFPFTEEEWKAFFVGLDNNEFISDYKQTEYMNLKEKDAFLLKQEDELWMALLHETQDGLYIWCIYSLVPVTEEMTSIKEYYLLPQELGEKTTEELLELASRNTINALIYEQMTLYLEVLCMRYNGAEELVKREDLTKVVLEAFQEDAFMIKKDLPQSQWKEQEAYDAECREKNYKIALEEVLLATNVAFDQMDEEMKQATLQEAYEKVNLRLSGRFASGNTIGTYPFGFFGYIRATKDSGSKWYDYLVEQGEEEVLKLMEDEFIHKFKP